MYQKFKIECLIYSVEPKESVFSLDNFDSAQSESSVTKSEYTITGKFFTY